MKVLIPLDGSAAAEAIIPFAVKIAGPLDMEVVLVQVVQPIPPTVIEGARHVELDDIDARRAEATRYLQARAEELRAKGVRAACEVAVGRPADEIAEAARKGAVDMVAMTTHGRGGFGKLLFGSVAEELLRQADVPLFLMRQGMTQGAARA